AASVHPEPGSNSPQKTFQKETGREKPNTQPKTNQPTPKQAPDWQKSKNYKVQQPTPTRRGYKAGPITIRETCSTTPHAHYEPKDDAISHWNSTTPPPAHTQTQGAHHTVHKKSRQTHPRNKSTLAHYRVLKQHQHTHQPEPNTAPAGKSDFVRSYTTNQPQVKLTLNPG
ncbi:hypothetical protein MHJ82_09260, partial [Corynebacterium afermentans]|uniref:hypothetical protein n=1 Tax=Corynebacterium afermentans TaxID=38286 RepID=UPI0025740CFB